MTGAPRGGQWWKSWWAAAVGLATIASGVFGGLAVFGTKAPDSSITTNGPLTDSIVTNNQSGGNNTVNVYPKPGARHNPYELQQKLRPSLAASPSEVTVAAADTGGRETYDYAKEWQQLLEAAGWSVTFETWMGSSPNIGLFALVRTDEKDSPPKGFFPLVTALRQNGVNVVTADVPGGPDLGHFWFASAPQQ